MKTLSWLAIPAIILTFMYWVVPAILWLVDRVFRKPLGEQIFKVDWNIWGMLAAVACWMADRAWVWWM